MSEDSSEESTFNSVVAYYSIARALQTRKDYRRAVEYLGKALKKDERHIPSLLLRSLCYMYLCETSEALADVEQVLQYDPKNPHAKLLLGEIHYLRGDFEEALRTFHQGRNMRPTINEFSVGVHKCEAAIQNNCTGCQLELAPDVDLTEFYMKAFPPKQSSRPTKPGVVRRVQSESVKPVPVWPQQRSPTMQRKLLKGIYCDFKYLEKVFEHENERLKQYDKGVASELPKANEIVNRSDTNRRVAANCGIYLDKHADLFHKMDPGFRNLKND